MAARPTTPETQDESNRQNRTRRAQRTRQSLLDSARSVFTRDGFHDARITDIADDAQVAHGSFYTYFDSKREIFVALIQQVLSEGLDHPHTTSDGQNEGTFAHIRRRNLEYLELYRRNGRLIAIWEELAFTDEKIATLLREARSTYTERTLRLIVGLQEQGSLPAGIDPSCAARALTGMVYRFAFDMFAAGESDQVEIETAATQLALLWVNALGMERPRRRSAAVARDRRDQAASDL